jgi:hypothetical protein
VAVRIAVTLCVLWLLVRIPIDAATVQPILRGTKTAGWNMITVARRPMCLPDGAGLEGWEAGSTCVVGRIGVAVSFLAL